jgi:thiamine pyrophosphokinase
MLREQKANMRPTKPNRALLICNGEARSSALARKLASNAELIIAADGGANVARRLNLHPDIIIGDLDSILPSTLRHFACSEIIRVARQDNTDFEKALDLLVERCIAEVAVVGVTGGRIDFTLGNLAVIWKYTARLRITIHGEGWRGIPVGGELKLNARIGTTVSLVPFGVCRGITLRGFKYPLTNAVMKVGEIGVSNVVRRSPCSIVVDSGHMLAIVFEKPHRKRPSR